MSKKKTGSFSCRNFSQKEHETLIHVFKGTNNIQSFKTINEIKTKYEFYGIVFPTLIDLENKNKDLIYLTFTSP